MSDDTSIADLDQVASLLDSVQRHQLCVNLLSASASAPEPSMLLASSRSNRQLVFDAPRNISDGLYQPGSVLTAMAVYQGAQLRFDSTVIGIDDAYQDYPALRTAWPDKVFTRQRRKSFRVRIGEDMSSRLELYDTDGKRIRGQLTDISLGGFGALIDHTAPLRVGEEIESLLEIEGGLSLITTIQLRDLRVPHMARHMRIGASFADLNPQQRAQLEKLIRAIERHLIRTEGSRR